MEIASQEVRLDVRPVEPKHRLDTILNAWNDLPVGDVLLLYVDHDPQCMYHTLAAEYGTDMFAFDYLESGPVDWAVKVTRLK